MKNILKLIVFIVCTVLVFFIRDWILLGLIFAINLILVFMLNSSIKNILYNLKIILPFVIFTAIINAFLSNLNDGLLMGARILLCYFITYIFSKTITVLEISNTIEKICLPLTIFKVNTKNIGIMISISICMIPVLRSEINTTKNSLKAKGKKLGIGNIGIIMKPILISILRRTNELERALISKGYIGE